MAEVETDEYVYVCFRASVRVHVVEQDYMYPYGYTAMDWVADWLSN